MPHSLRHVFARQTAPTSAGLFYPVDVPVSPTVCSYLVTMVLDAYDAKVASGPRWIGCSPLQFAASNEISKASRSEFPLLNQLASFPPARYDF